MPYVVELQCTPPMPVISDTQPPHFVPPLLTFQDLLTDDDLCVYVSVRVCVYVFVCPSVTSFVILYTNI